MKEETRKVDTSLIYFLNLPGHISPCCKAFWCCWELQVAPTQSMHRLVWINTALLYSHIPCNQRGKSYLVSYHASQTAKLPYKNNNNNNDDSKPAREERKGAHETKSCNRCHRISSLQTNRMNRAEGLGHFNCSDSEPRMFLTSCCLQR